MMIKPVIIAFISISTLVASPVHAGEVSGWPRVVDGDGLEFEEAGVTIRLASVDAPEKDQPGGQEALLVLSTIVKRTPIRCEWADTGRYSRAIGTCYSQNRDGSWAKRSINQRLVEGGWACGRCWNSGRMRRIERNNERSAYDEAPADILPKANSDHSLIGRRLDQRPDRRQAPA